MYRWHVVLAMTLVAWACSPGSRLEQCPPVGTEFSGHISGGLSGRVRVVVPKAGHLTLFLQPEAVGMQPSDPALELGGPVSCGHGVLRGRLSGITTSKGHRILGTVIEGLYQPQLLPVELALGWSADMVDPSGKRAKISGSLVGVQQ